MSKTLPPGIRVLFVAGFGPVTRDPVAADDLYRRTLGLPLEPIPGYDHYFHTEGLAGVKHFALWPLDKAAESCFGTPDWPDDVPVPQAWLELDVEDIVSATSLLEEAGHRLLVRLRDEPWEQTVSRFLSPEGLLLALTHTPALRDEP